MPYKFMGDVDHAIADLSKAIWLDPGASFAIYLRASYHAKGEYDHAIQDFDEAIRFNLTFPAIFSDRGDADRARAT
jgi:tetratricopeptide (TPR) repeat protein